LATEGAKGCLGYKNGARGEESRKEERGEETAVKETDRQVLSG
jgi:hypothetical protein